MKTIILNWEHGQNNPFTVASDSIAKIFRRSGKIVEILQFTDEEWLSKLDTLVSRGVDFVYTWQGIGSGTKMPQSDQSIWEFFKTPLICIHGDHPAYMPPNHELESKYCIHYYTNPDFVSYSNAHFRKKYAAQLIDIPQLFYEDKLQNNNKNEFCIIKNINPLGEMCQTWERVLPRHIYDAYIKTTDFLKHRVISEKYVEIHFAIDELILIEGWEWFITGTNLDLYHHFHRSMDSYIRSYRSTIILEDLTDVNLSIYGSGWTEIAKNKSKNWRFSTGLDMKKSQPLFYSKYGIIDISPSKRLHDRTRRAMANMTPFLSSANIEDQFSNTEHYDKLFYDFQPKTIRERCEEVMKSPELHWERSKTFSIHYHQTFHHRNFTMMLDSTAQSIRRAE